MYDRRESNHQHLGTSAGISVHRGIDEPKPSDDSKSMNEGIAVNRPNLQLDGIITVRLTNQRHFTYRLRTVKDGGLAGKRIVELLIGPDNQHSYKGFGFMYDTGRVSIWTRCYTEAYIKHANLLMGNHQDMVVEWMQAGRCMKCGRLLSNPESITIGIGPKCRKM